MPFGVGFEPETSFAKRRLFADAGDDILQLATFVMMIKHVVCCDDRRAASFAKLGDGCDSCAIIAAISVGCGEVERDSSERSFYSMEGLLK